MGDLDLLFDGPTRVRTCVPTRRGPYYDSRASICGGIPQATANLRLVLCVIPLTLSWMVHAGDLVLDRVAPFQASFESSVLVKNKSIKFSLEITSTFPGTVTVPIQFQELDDSGLPKGPDSHVVDGRVSLHVLTQDLHLAPGTHSYIFPHDEAPLSIVAPFVHEPGPVGFGIVVDSGDTLDEDSEANNWFLNLYPVVEVMQLRVMYVPISLGASTYNSAAPTEASMDRFASFTSEYLLGALPVSEFGELRFVDHVSHTVIDFPTVDFFNIEDAIGNLSLMHWLGGITGSGPYYDMFVGVFGKEALSDTYGGVSFLLDHHGIVVDEELTPGPATAHEMGHAMAGLDHNMVDAPGYWINRECRMGHFDWSVPRPNGGECYYSESALDLMFTGFSRAAPGAPKVVRWIGKDTWESLVGVLAITDTERTQRVIGIFVCVDGQDNVRSYPWYTFDGIPDIPLGNTGRYRMLYLDGNGARLGETGVDSLSRISHGEGDCSILNCRIPYVQGAQRIVFKRDDTTLLERGISRHLPFVGISRPLSDMTFRVGDRITVQWDGVDQDGDALSFVVFASLDDGRVWIPVTREMMATQCEFVVPREAEAGAFLIKVIVTDGVNTSEDVSERIPIAGSGQGPFTRGDANATNGTDIADAIFLLSHFFAKGPAPTCRDAGDANDDGHLDIGDAIRILGYLFADAGPLPPPSGRCDRDPTDDALDCSSFPPCRVSQ